MSPCGAGRAEWGRGSRSPPGCCRLWNLQGRIGITEPPPPVALLQLPRGPESLTAVNEAEGLGQGGGGGAQRQEQGERGGHHGGGGSRHGSGGGGSAVSHERGGPARRSAGAGPARGAGPEPPSAHGRGRGEKPPPWPRARLQPRKGRWGPHDSPCCDRGLWDSPGVVVVCWSYSPRTDGLTPSPKVLPLALPTPGLSWDSQCERQQPKDRLRYRQCHGPGSSFAAPAERG